MKRCCDTIGRSKITGCCLCGNNGVRANRYISIYSDIVTMKGEWRISRWYSIWKSASRIRLWWRYFERKRNNTIVLIRNKKRASQIRRGGWCYREIKRNKTIFLIRNNKRACKSWRNGNNIKSCWNTTLTKITGCFLKCSNGVRANRYISIYSDTVTIKGYWRIVRWYSIWKSASRIRRGWCYLERKRNKTIVLIRNNKRACKSWRFWWTKEWTFCLRHNLLNARQIKIRHWETKPAVLVGVNNLLGIILAVTVCTL